MKSLYPAKLPSGQWQLPGQQQRASPCCPQPAAQSHQTDGVECRGHTAASQLQRQTPHSLAFPDWVGHVGLPQWTEELKRSEGLSCQYHPELCPVGPSRFGQRSSSGNMPTSCLLVSVWARSADKAPQWPQLCHSLVTGQERCHAVFSGTENSAKGDAWHASGRRWPDSCQGLPVSSPLQLRSLLQMSSNLEQS